MLLEPPNNRNTKKKEFIREYDSYGRPSFRQVVVEQSDTEKVCWKKHIYIPSLKENLFQFLTQKTKENGEEFSYISCDFGLDADKIILKALEPCQQEYIQGILWKKTRMYHRLTSQMREIIFQLYEQGLYEGECYFNKSGEHVIVLSPS